MQKQLVWSEEFDGAQLDQGRWNIEKGYLDVNSEKENYQEGNLEVRDGNLVITARRERVDKQDYTSGRINTAGKFSFTYGRAEARIKLPRVQGTWPAFWLLGANIESVGWPKCGEIDIMEQVNNEDDVLGTLHWEHNGSADYGSKTNVGSTADWHVYAVEWDANNIRMLVDDRQYFIMDISNSEEFQQFHQPFFIILNLAVGGDLTGGANIDDGALPAQMLVDYVRVYSD
ncbi:hypothetical protein AAVH_08237 [Aphelenchoides avenae]|nr:hypothetical protein AAVH_08237 [Aphelenchus avenae]